MSKSSRRKFLLTSSGAMAGTFVSSNILEAKPQAQKKSNNQDLFLDSGLVTGEKKPLKYQSIPDFLSEEQITPHFEAHYEGALKGYTAADDKLQSSIINNEEIDSNAYVYSFTTLYLI